MCGIAGYVGRVRDERFLNRAVDLQHHRGPDDQGTVNLSCGNIQVGFAHNRLSILDLSSAAHQPMIDKASGISLVFNGEIYNYKELRNDLEALGYTFVSTGDTEVVLKGYLAWHEKVFSLLRGMFAIAIWDPSVSQLHLVRDHLGKKPLFWRISDKSIYFASDISALRNESSQVSPEAVQDYFTYLYVPAPRTIWRNISALPPATHLVFDARNGTVETHRFWKYAQENDADYTLAISYEDALVEAEERLRKAVEQRLVSDRPAGIFLSGGLDSSVIAAIAAQGHNSDLNTYSVSLNAPSYAYNESEYARKVAEHIGSTHEELQIDAPPADDVFDILARGFGQPFGNPTAILSYLLTKEARSRMIVGLIGDGADEIFLGYPRYRFANLASRLNTLTFGSMGWAGKAIASMVGESAGGNHLFRRLRLFSSTFSDPNAIFEWASYYHYGLRESLLKSQTVTDFDFFKRLEESYTVPADQALRAARLDIESFVPCNLLENADRMGMANSFELRAPFLDVDLVSFIMSLPLKYRLQGKVTKRLLRTIGQKYLPAITTARKKRGFNPPVGIWLNEKLDAWYSQYVTSSSSSVFDCFLNKTAIGNMVKLHKSRKMDLSTELWGLFMFLCWYGREVDGKQF